MLYTHPIVIVFISAILLLLFRNYSKIFNLLAILYPIISLLLADNSRYDVFSISKINLISNITPETYQTAVIFIFVTFIANIIAVGNNRKWEVIMGTFANFAALLCLFAQDFISMFIGIELLMVASTILIFIGGMQDSIKAARQYFLTHIFSGGLILIGISYLITISGGTEIISLTDLVNNKDQGFLFYILLCAGCLINVATVPFAGWLVNCYPKASGSGFIYLTAFSTKITLILLIKLFSGLAALKLIGIIMMIYGGFYACFEDNLRKILCYLIVSQLGLMVVAISIGTKASIGYVIGYIPIHICYIALFIYLIVLLESVDIKSCHKIRNIKNFTFTISLLIAILMISNFPFTLSFTYKSLLSQASLGNFTYYLVLLLNSLIFIALPFREYFTDRVKLSILIPNFDKAGLFFLILAIITPNIIMIRSYLSAQESIEITEPVIKQLIVIAIGIILTFIIKIPRFSTNNLNLDLLQLIEITIKYFANRYKKEPINEEEITQYFYFKPLINNILNKITISHTQQASIFTVLFLLISLICMLQL